MQEIERSAGSVEEAVEAALAELGLSEQEAEIEIVQEPRAGFLGLNSSPAVVRVRAIASRESQPAETAGGEGAADEAIEEQVEVAADFLEGLLDAMSLDADVEPVTLDGTTYVDLWGAEGSEGMGLLIGRHGHTLDALQELVRTVVQRQTELRCQVMVDVEDYRKRRRAHIVRRATDAARRVRKTGRPEALDPMTAFERKIVHDTVADLGGLDTASEGEDPNRRVVISKRQ